MGRFEGRVSTRPLIFTVATHWQSRYRVVAGRPPPSGSEARNIETDRSSYLIILTLGMTDMPGPSNKSVAYRNAEFPRCYRGPRYRASANERIGPQGRITGEVNLNHQHVAVGVRGDTQGEREALMRMHDFDSRSARRQQPQSVIFQSFDFHPKAKAIGHDETEISDLQNIGTRIIHFVDNAESEREPDARGS